MKILINTPRLVPHGGVANHYIGLKPYWNEEVIYNPIGKKGNKSGSGVYRLPLNIITFVRKIFSFKPDIILLNPSLSKGAMVLVTDSTSSNSPVVMLELMMVSLKLKVA